MSLLCVDIGNSSTTLGLLDDGDVLAHWRVSTAEHRTADEWGVLVRGLLADVTDSSDVGGVTGVAVCATVPSVLHAWRQMLQDQFRVPSVIVEPGTKSGMPVLVDNPREVGADRVVNALAAQRCHGAPGIVVDLGTATTYDVVDAEGRYIGGAIAPGLEISMEALHRHGAQLRTVELVRPRSVIAKNTVEALQSGLLHGFAAQIEGMIRRIIGAGELDAGGAVVNVIATGYLAPILLEECDSFTVYDPHLTLRGLELVFLRNHQR